MRNRMIAVAEGANEQSSEAATKTVMLTANSRRVPKRRRSQPVSGATTAVAHR